MKSGRHIDFDAVATYRQRLNTVGTISALQSYGSATTIHISLKSSERWKAATDKIDIERVLMFECRYHDAINTSTTVIAYSGRDYKVTSLEVIGRKQYLKITAIQDQK